MILLRLMIPCFENTVWLPVSAQGHTAPNRKTAEPGPAGITGNWSGGMKAKNRRDTGSHLRSVKAWSLKNCSQRV